ncbi:hypothetical protein NBRC116602_29900 [Hyphomicrobiales bacterium 4NK60-0047b]
MDGFNLIRLKHFLKNFFGTVFDIIGQQDTARLFGIETSMRTFALPSNDGIKENIHAF